jgi:hypothetical protein
MQSYVESASGEARRPFVDDGRHFFHEVFRGVKFEAAGCRRDPRNRIIERHLNVGRITQLGPNAHFDIGHCRVEKMSPCASAAKQRL